MLENVLNVTSDAVPRTFGRRQTNTPATLGKFLNASGDVGLEIRQKKTRNRQRHELVFTHTKDVVNAVGPATAISMSAGFYIDEPNLGFTDAEHVIMRNLLFALANQGPVMVGLSTNDT